MYIQPDFFDLPKRRSRTPHIFSHCSCLQKTRCPRELSHTIHLKELKIDGVVYRLRLGIPSRLGYLQGPAADFIAETRSHPLRQWSAPFLTQ